MLRVGVLPVHFRGQDVVGFGGFGLRVGVVPGQLVRQL